MSGFSPDQVVNLAAKQTGGAFHPFTCPNRGDGNHRDVFGDLGALVPTVRGWICPFCDYTQGWAHGVMKEGAIEQSSPTAIRLPELPGVEFEVCQLACTSSADCRRRPTCQSMMAAAVRIST